MNFPFASHFLELDGIRYHYVDEGRGAPVVMLHGNPTWSFYYRNLVTALRGRYRCVVPDHIGCGLSDKPDESRYSYTLASRVRDLAELLDHLDITRHVTLVMHDWGGMIGFAYAVQNADRIARLIVMNTAAFHLPRGKRLPLSLRICRTRLGPLLVQGLNLFVRGAARFCFQHPVAPSVRQSYVEPYDSWQHRLAVLRFVQDIPIKPDDRCHELVSQVEARLDILSGVPMMLCWGERDFVFDRDFLQEWCRRFPSAEVHRFPGAGHYVLEDAFHDIMPRIDAFLNRYPAELSDP